MTQSPKITPANIAKLAKEQILAVHITQAKIIQCHSYHSIFKLTFLLENHLNFITTYISSFTRYADLSSYPNFDLVIEPMNNEKLEK